MEVACLSGEMSKEQRQNTLAKFRQGKFRGLVVSGDLHSLLPCLASAPLLILTWQARAP